MPDTHPPKRSFSKFFIIVSLASFVVVLMGISMLLEAWHIEESDPFAKNWLVSLGAGFLGMAGATLVATLTGWFCCKTKA